MGCKPGHFRDPSALIQAQEWHETHVVCGKKGCKPATCPKGNPGAQEEYADRKAARERENAQRQAHRFQGVIDLSEDEAVFDGENAQRLHLIHWVLLKEEKICQLLEMEPWESGCF